MNMVFIVLTRKEVSRVLPEPRKECGSKMFAALSEVSKYAGGCGMIK